MTYILETKLQDNKYLYFALQTIYGINRTQSFILLKKLGVSKNLKVKNLSENQIKKLLFLVEKSDLVITSELKKK